MRLRIGTFFVFAALVVALLLPALAFNTDPAQAAVTLTENEQKLVNLINKQRTRRGLHKLYVNSSLTNAARTHSQEMGELQYFSHDSANGEAFSRRLIRHGYRKSGYSFWKAGENIAWGTGLYSTPEATVQAWMASPGHRAVILTKCFRNIGVGAVVCEQGYKSVDTPVTFFTMDLGRRIK